MMTKKQIKKLKVRLFVGGVILILLGIPFPVVLVLTGIEYALEVFLARKWGITFYG
jgi:hypothetical protein